MKVFLKKFIDNFLFLKTLSEVNLFRMEGEILTAKTVIIGLSAVGKTCIANRYFSDTFDNMTQSTMGSQFFEGYIKLSENKTFKFEVWDTAGQENYMALAPVFFTEATIAILVYDVTRPETLHGLDYYVKVLKETAPDCFIAVCGNKIDLVDRRKVEYTEGVKYSESIGSTFFIETSAKTDEGIKTLFESLSRQEGLHFKKKNGLNEQIGNEKPKESAGCC
ncbi:Ras-related protein RABF1 [Tritrichomonas foetus]|uniref:Ras-related protein RABF1 n=1 Tax=Tritrichomonas foetus TaxID=1144522 RepID=A0A1J4K3W5_9EUKA|nr:Ras-related protein RABF1 [Tritrichomonas foetus]|eukprot:OHT05666.1 Ras-related protein RABF1 [Tritrichomonas foetus]